MGRKGFAFGSYLVLAVAALGSAIVVSGPAYGDGGGAPAAPLLNEAQKTQLVETYGRGPLAFIENRGQVDQQVRYYTRGGGQSIGFTREGLVFALRRGETQAPEGGDRLGGKFRLLAKSRDNLKPAIPPPANRPWWGAAWALMETLTQPSTPFPATPTLEPVSPDWTNQEQASTNTPPALVQMTPVGMRRGVKVAALEPQDCKVNYFIGNDPKKWRTDIPTYKAVVYQEAYPGIDLKFYGAGRQLEYDIIVKPGADPNRVKFKYAGIQGLKVTPEGDLAISLPDGGELLQKKPLVYQEIGGQKVAREAKFKLHENEAGHTFGFKVAAYDKKHPLIIDPVLVYSTYFGGDNIDEGFGITVDSAGNAYITGVTYSAFPYYNRQGPCDAFMMKLDNLGNISYMILLGGSGREEGRGIAVDSYGNAYLTGWTDSVDFPCKNTDIAQSLKGTQGAFVVQLDYNGHVNWSTVLGGTGADGGAGIALDPPTPEAMPNVYVTGWANSQTFLFSPQAPPPLLYPSNGSGDAFVVKIGLSQFYPKALYYCFLGGSSRDEGNGIAVDAAGNAYITGWTYSSDMPVYPSSFTYQGAEDAFVAKINDRGVMWSICLGGSGDEYGSAIAVDANNNIFVTGGTIYSSNFGGLGAPSLYPYGGDFDAFVVKIRQLSTFPSGLLVPHPVYYTFLGGTDLDEGRGIGVDSSGNVYVTGCTSSSDFPTRDPLLIKSSLSDAFVAKLNAAGTALVYSTRLGGDKDDYSNAIAVDNAGNAYVTGSTSSSDFPTRMAWQSVKGGGKDAFVTKLSPKAVPKVTPILELLLLGN